MSIYFAKLNLFPGLKEIPNEVPPEEELLETMCDEANSHYGGVGAWRGVYGKDHPRYGTIQSQKQKSAMSQARKGKKHSEETRRKLVESWEERKKNFISSNLKHGACANDASIEVKREYWRELKRKKRKNIPYKYKKWEENMRNKIKEEC